MSRSVARAVASRSGHRLQPAAERAQPVLHRPGVPGQQQVDRLAGQPEQRVPGVLAQLLQLEQPAVQAGPQDLGVDRVGRLELVRVQAVQLVAVVGQGGRGRRPGRPRSCRSAGRRTGGRPGRWPARVPAGAGPRPRPRRARGIGRRCQPCAHNVTAGRGRPSASRPAARTGSAQAGVQVTYMPMAEGDRHDDDQRDRRPPGAAPPRRHPDPRPGGGRRAGAHRPAVDGPAVRGLGGAHGRRRRARRDRGPPVPAGRHPAGRDAARPRRAVRAAPDPRRRPRRAGRVPHRARTPWTTGSPGSPSARTTT